MPGGLNLAPARCLQQPQTVAYHLLRGLVALPLVVELQARPLIRIHGLQIGCLQLAVGRWLRCEQRALGPVNSQLRVYFGRRGSRCGGGFCLDFTLSGMVGATGDRHCARYGAERQKP